MLSSCGLFSFVVVVLASSWPPLCRERRNILVGLAGLGIELALDSSV
jgi:hypothetical protein